MVKIPLIVLIEIIISAMGVSFLYGFSLYWFASAESDLETGLSFGVAFLAGRYTGTVMKRIEALCERS